MSPELAARIPGASELIAWFGQFPRFHDAYVKDFVLRMDGSGHLVLRAFRITDQVKDGYLVLDKHFTATIFFEGVSSAEMTDFIAGEAIAFDIEISEQDGAFALSLDSSYGFCGDFRMKALRVEFQPGEERS